MMYYCHYTYEASKHPKFLNDTCKLLTDADGKLFIDVQDVEILAIKVRKALEKAMPKGSTAKADKHTTNEGEITINVYANVVNDAPSVGRAYFKPVRAIVTYDLDDEDFVEFKLKMEVKKYE